MPLSLLETNDVTISKGVLFEREDSSSGYRDMGEVKEVNLNIEIQNQDFISGREGTNKKTKSVAIQTESTGTATLYVPKAKNLELYALSGSPETTSLTAATSQSGNATAKLNLWVPIVNLDTLNFDNIVVQDSTDTTTYELGTDYEIDKELGWIRALSTGSISADEVLNITYDQVESEFYDIFVGEKTSIEREVFFKGQSPTGVSLDVYGFASIKGTGSLPLITEDFLGFQIEYEFISRNSVTGFSDNQLVRVRERKTVA